MSPLFAAKSLIFSQFQSPLGWLQEELPRHGFQYRTIHGGMSMTERTKAQSEFQNDASATVFLLSMNSSACGINLTQANRVFLVEPSVDPTLEAQAIGRVFRLGQERPTEIIRLVMEDSVETRMIRVLDKKYGRGSGSSLSNNTSSGANKIGQKQPALGAAASSSAMTGGRNIFHENLDMVEEEFDLLFGLPEKSSSA